ncbi:SMI1/KNR4 family protein [Phyllobacterium sp. K27]
MDLKSLNPTLFASYEQAKAYPPDEFGARWKEVGAEEAEQFKSKTGLDLPADYLEFVGNFGEFTIWTDDFEKLYARAIWETGKSANAEIGKIVGPAGVLESRQSYLGAGSGARIPENFAPLTFDSGYGHAMLDLSKDNFGKIRYLQVKTKPFGSDGYGWDQVATLADNFTEFVSQINSKKGLTKALGAPKKA